MRKLLFSLLALTVLTTSCEKEIENINPLNDDAVISVKDDSNEPVAENVQFIYEDALEWITSSQSHSIYIAVSPTLYAVNPGDVMNIDIQDVNLGFPYGIVTRSETWEVVSTVPHTLRNGAVGNLTTYNVISGGTGTEKIFRPSNGTTPFKLLNYSGQKMVDMVF